MARCFDGRLCVQMVFTELVVKLRKEGGSLKEHLEGLYKKWGTFSFFLVFSLWLILFPHYLACPLDERKVPKSFA